MLERNKPGKGRKNRINISLPTDYETKLRRLAIACNAMPPTTLAYHLIKYCLDDPQIISLFQSEHAAHDDYRVIMVRSQNGWDYDVLRHNQRSVQ